MLRFLIEKEFKQLIRNQFVLFFIIWMPVLMMFFLPWAANQEIKDIKLSVVDNDHSTFSQRLIYKLTASGYFKLTDLSSTYSEAMNSVQVGDADVIIEIPAEFETDLLKQGSTTVMISANSVNGAQGALSLAYLSMLVADFADELRAEAGFQPAAQFNIPVIKIVSQNRYNPYLDYKVFMAPAMLMMILTLLSGFLPALNIVNEKEIGTIEQINVSPVKRVHFILSKLIPYWIVGIFVMTISFIIIALVYKLVPQGSIFTLYLYGWIYILVVSGMGLVIANYSATMQQAIFEMFFFLIVMILISGLLTPVSSMPEWAQVLAYCNPLTYFVQTMRMVYLKGSTVAELLPQMGALCLFALLFFIWAIISYRKRN